MIRVGLHCSHTFEKSVFPWQYAINLESVGYLWSECGGAQEMTKMESFNFVRVHFHNSEGVEQRNW